MATLTQRVLPPVVLDVLQDTCSTLLSNKKCCTDFVIGLNLLDPFCLKLGITKALGYGIIIASTLVKLPQVLKIMSNKSGAGIAVLGVLMELMAITFNASYSYAKRFPFTAWGETIFLLVETALIAFLVLFYDGKKGQALVFLVTHSAIVYILTSGFTPINVLWSFQACNLPLAVTGKLVQAYNNLKNGHTGQMSAITVWMLCLGCVARVFTSIQETGDQLTIMTYLVASVANGLLVAQVHYYWKETDKFLKKQKSE